MTFVVQLLIFAIGCFLLVREGEKSSRSHIQWHCLFSRVSFLFGFGFFFLSSVVEVL